MTALASGASTADALHGVRVAVADDRVSDAIIHAAEVVRHSLDEACITEAVTLIPRPVDPLVRARLHALAASARLRDNDATMRERIETLYAATVDPFDAAQARAADLDRLAREGHRARLLDAVAALAWAASTPRDHSRAQLLLASQAVTDGLWDAATTHLTRAEAISGPGSDAAYLVLPYRSTIAILTGVGLAEVVPAVREVVERLPFLARSWLASVLLAAGERAEAARLWSSLTPHLESLPPAAAEFLIAGVDLARLCAQLDDRDSAPRLYAVLAPFTGQHAIGHATGPYEGPVDLALGRLAATTGDRTGLAATCTTRSICAGRCMPRLTRHSCSRSSRPSRERGAGPELSCALRREPWRTLTEWAPY